MSPSGAACTWPESTQITPCLGNAPGSLQNGGEDATYTTDPNGKLTVYMDATQFRPDGYGGQLTNADLDYWFELSDIDNNTYYPTLVNIQGTMSPGLQAAHRQRRGHPH